MPVKQVPIGYELIMLSLLSIVFKFALIEIPILCVFELIIKCNSALSNGLDELQSIGISPGAEMYALTTRTSLEVQFTLPQGDCAKVFEGRIKMPNKKSSAILFKEVNK